MSSKQLPPKSPFYLEGEAAAHNFLSWLTTENALRVKSGLQPIRYSMAQLTEKKETLCPYDSGTVEHSEWQIAFGDVLS